MACRSFQAGVRMGRAIRQAFPPAEPSVVVTRLIIQCLIDLPDGLPFSSALFEQAGMAWFS